MRPPFSGPYPPHRTGPDVPRPGPGTRRSGDIPRGRTVLGSVLPAPAPPGGRSMPGASRPILVNAGAEAVENAVKVARAAAGRPGIVVFDHAFHGRTLLTMGLTAKNKPYKQGFGPFAPEIHRAPMAYPYRWPTGPDRCAE